MVLFSIKYNWNILNEVQNNESKYSLHPQSRVQAAFSYLNFGLTRALPINEEEYVCALFLYLLI